MFNHLFVAADTVASGIFSGVTADMFMGMFDEIKGLIPVVIPVAVGFMAIRKGWSFLMSNVAGA